MEVMSRREILVWASLLTERLRVIYFGPFYIYIGPKYSAIRGSNREFGLGKCQLEFEGVVYFMI